MSGWTRADRHRLRAVAVAVVVVLTTTGTLDSASASSLGVVTARSIFSGNVTSAPVVPRMRMADSFTSSTFGPPGVFTTGRIPQDRLYLSNTWTVTSGNWSIASGTAVPQNGSTRIAIYDGGNADAVTAAVLRRVSTFDAGLIVRSNGTATTYLLAQFRNTAGGTLTFRKVIAGVSTALATVNNLGNLTAIPMRIEASGTSISVYYNNTLALARTLSPDEQTTFGALTASGIWVANANSETFDDFYIASWPAS